MVFRRFFHSLPLLKAFNGLEPGTAARIIAASRAWRAATEPIEKVV